MTPADQAVSASLQFESKKDGLSQLQDGSWVLKLKVHPSEIPAALLTAPMGTRFVSVLVEVSDDETPVSPEAQEQRTKPAKDRRSWSSLPPSQQAAIRCTEPAFRKFVSEQTGMRDVSEDDAAAFVRNDCEVHSRAHLDANTAATARWREIDADFQFWLKHPEAA